MFHFIDVDSDILPTLRINDFLIHLIFQYRYIIRDHMVMEMSLTILYYTKLFHHTTLDILLSGLQMQVWNAT